MCVHEVSNLSGVCGVAVVMAALPSKGVRGPAVGPDKVRPQIIRTNNHLCFRRTLHLHFKISI